MYTSPTMLLAFTISSAEATGTTCGRLPLRFSRTMSFSSSSVG